jgi:hypothetical protein
MKAIDPKGELLEEVPPGGKYPSDVGLAKAAEAGKKATLKQMSLTNLQVRCQQVADNVSMDATIAEKARQLRREWGSLVALGRPSTLKEQQQVKKKLAELKTRMVDFLATI